MLKVLMLRRSADAKKAELAELERKDSDFITREAELETAINEVEPGNAEQEEAVNAEIEKFEADKTAHEEAKQQLSADIEGIEAEIAEIERNAPVPPAPEKKTKKTERGDMHMDINIRSLPMTRRAFDALPVEQRNTIIAQDDVKTFLGQLRGMRGQSRAVTGAELTIPVVFLELISENMFRYSKLLNRVRIRYVNGQARQTIAGTVPEAVWTEMCGAINELNFVFNQVTLDGYKVAGYVPVCNSLLDDNDINLSGWIVEMLSESIGYAMDKAILYGKGSAARMPLGIVTRLAQKTQPSDYPANAPAWVNLSTSNILQIGGADVTGAEFWSALMTATGATYTRYSRGELFWSMNSKTYATLRSKVITFTATGDIAANVFGVLPIITGDVDILTRQAPYFKDAQAMRGAAIDKRYRPEQGCWQTDEAGGVYTGTILEHLLIQQLAAFYEVGEHNIYRLRGADWNDALDMAAERGESVAFTCAYAGNLRELAGLIRLLEARTGVRSVELLEELQVLLDAGPETFGDPAAKAGVLEQYAARCSHRVSGRRVRVSLAALAEGLEQKADWLTGWLRAHEWIDAGEGEGWYNSYYDNSGRRVEGVFPDGVRMMLTGQVFAIMSGVASDGQAGQSTRAADRYLYRPEIGGYRLNTNFHELKFDLGRMFGFAYGEKENGAVFSHMAVMYANALYRRGFVQEGWKALKTLADTALDFDTSHIYPGIPEYFRADGRGMYHYLTGAASWYMMTMITQAFGVRGEAGDLALEPKLTAGQFDAAGLAAVCVTFAGRRLEVCYRNPDGLDWGSYQIGQVLCDGAEWTSGGERCLLVPRTTVEALAAGPVHRITVTLIPR